MILFRQLNDNIPEDWVPGLHWQVEHHDDEYDMAFPTGIAWVSAHTPEGEEPFVYLDFLLVPDMYRREGIATEIVKACKERWPTIDLGEAISEEGEAFLNSLEKVR